MAAMAATARISSAGAALDVVAHSRVDKGATSSGVQVFVKNVSAFVGQGVKVAANRSWERREPQRRSVILVTRASESPHGQDPDWSDDDYIVLGLAHCFRKDENGKLKDVFVVEPVTAGTLECMENGGVTCYKCVTATNLGVALQEKVELLPAEMQGGVFGDEFDFRAKCASRTWKRDHPQNNLLHIVPRDGVKSDYNFSIEDKRVLNAEVVVNDSDNIKQDMSIDVYGREKEEEMKNEINQLYSV
uniref:Uncharacterized protein n=1 Tax=Physcomitrium patens TaxID=3218 RepID=A0A2K1IJD4_PHYPA|nr:hypothetical protein PHYPA_028084 [Physcomitrium patens]